MTNDEKDYKELDAIKFEDLFLFFDKIFARVKNLEKRDLKKDIEKIILSNSLTSENLVRKIVALDQIEKKYNINANCIIFIYKQYQRILMN